MLQCGGEEIKDIESLMEPPKNNKTYKNSMEIYCDILIIGAGVVGCALAREMAKYSAKVIVIDMADDIASGASKANSGIVHSGYDERHGTLKSKVAHIGNQLFRKLDSDLHFGFREVGSLVVAFSEDQLEDLQRLYDNGKKNGVTKLELISGDEARRREPSLSKHVVGAMYCPHTGVTSPYEYAIALAENAIYNGVDFMLGHEVVSIDKVENCWITRCTHGTTNLKFISPIVVNCAGINSDKIAAMVSEPFFKIVPRKGEYLLLDRTQAHLVKHVLFPVPSKKKGKGILVSPTYWGNVLLGPTSREQSEVMTNTQVLQHIMQFALKLIPDLDVKHAITSYSGFRAKTDIADFILNESPNMFLNMAGIDSPGLTSSPALAILASKQIIQMFEKMERSLRQNLSFNPSRPSIIIPKGISFKGRIDDEDPSKNIICRCERITEAEILDSMRRPIAAKTMNAVKRRTRAGMGICQGAFCESRIIKIIAKEFDIPENMVKRIEKPSSLLPHVRLTPEDKELLSTLASDKSSKM
jgi:glycerol-3-phosphate dehydrogenase